MLHRSLTKKSLLLSVLLSYTSLKALSWLKSLYTSSILVSKASKKLSSRNSLTLASLDLPDIPLAKQSLILSLTVSELSKSIRSLKITSVEAVSTYIIRSYTIGREYCLIAEECYASALAKARHCDDLLSQNINLGPFHGVPISVKDHISMEGCTSSAGVAWKLDYPDTCTALLIKLLEDQGAIPFVRSNLTQAIMWLETSNIIYGRALNPWNPLRTTGGSSGGEGGLVASRASPLGIGSDIGGSIRTPSAFCGVYGLKPTPQRISFQGVKSAFKHNLEPLDCMIQETLGPIGRSVKDLVMVMKAWWTDKLFTIDRTLPPLLFDSSCYKSTRQRKLKIGYFLDLPFFDSAPCIKNAIQICMDSLRDTHEVVEFEVPHAKELISLFTKATNGDGGESLRTALQGEPAESFYRLQLLSASHQTLTKLGLGLLNLTGNSRVADFLSPKAFISPSECIEIYQRMQDLTENLTSHWDLQGIDAVICPVFGLVAPEHERTVEVLAADGYSMIWNVVGYPTGIVPVGTVRYGETEYCDRYNDISTSAAKKCMEGSEGMPIALQVVSLPFKDEVVLGVMKIVEDIFQFHKHPI